VAKLIPYDVTGVEESQGGTGVKAKPGVYIAEIMRCTQRETKADNSPANDLEVALNVGPDYDWVFTYIGLGPASDWKMAEFIRAVGLNEKGRLDPDKMVGKKIRVKINPDSWEGNYTARAGRLMPSLNGDKDPGKVSEISSTGEAVDEDEDVDADEPTMTSEAEYPGGYQPQREDDDDSYDDWSDEDVVGEATDRGLTLPGGRGSKRDKAVKALRADDEAHTQQPINEEDDDDGETEAEDYSSWSTDELVKEYGERGFEDDVPEFKGRNAENRQRKAIIEALEADDGGDPFEA
jgi:hypothetical protein